MTLPDDPTNPTNANGRPSTHAPGDDLLDRSIAALRDAPAPEGPSPQTLTDTLATLRKEAGTPELNIKPVRDAPRRGLAQRILTMSLSQRLAATITITAGGVVLWFMLTLFSSVSYAQVAERIRATHSMTFTATSTMPGLKEPVAVKMMFLDPGHLRSELPGGGVLINDGPSGRTLSLKPSDKTAQLVNTGPQAAGAPQMDVAESFRALADEKGEPIGDRQIGDVKAKGFRVVASHYTSDVWADPKTKLPLLVEMTFGLADKSLRLVMSDFTFDPKLDEGLFSLTPPADYKVTTMKLDVNLNEEENVATLLKAYAAANDGQFPASLNDPALMSKMVKIGSDGKISPESMKAASSFGALNGLMFAEKKGIDFDYQPAGAKLGDANALVYWHKDEKTGKYRGVYGDLAIKDVAADQIPKRAN